MDRMARVDSSLLGGQVLSGKVEWPCPQLGRETSRSSRALLNKASCLRQVKCPLTRTWRRLVVPCRAPSGWTEATRSQRHKTDSGLPPWNQRYPHPMPTDSETPLVTPLTASSIHSWQKEADELCLERRTEAENSTNFWSNLTETTLNSRHWSHQMC